MNRRLNAFGPGDGNQFDITVHVADGEDALAAGFEIRIDRDTAVVIEPYAQSLEGVFGRQKPDLDHDGNAIDLFLVRQRELDPLAIQSSRTDLGRHMDNATGVADSGQSVQFSDRNGFTHDEINLAFAPKHHQRGVQSRIPSADDSHAIVLIVADGWNLVIDLFGMKTVE